MLTVITALSRPENIPRLAASILAATEFLQVQWLIVVDERSSSVDQVAQIMTRWRLRGQIWGAKGDCSGAPQKNRGIRYAPSSGWVYFLDDDNLIHPSIPPVLAATEPDSILLFPQVDAAGELLRDERTPEQCWIDLAQFAVPAAWAAESMFPTDEHDSDWFYLEALLKTGRPFRWVNDARAFYNAVKPA